MSEWFEAINSQFSKHAVMLKMGAQCGFLIRAYVTRVFLCVCMHIFAFSLQLIWTVQ